MSLSKLADDMILEIISFLNEKDMERLKNSYKRIKEICNKKDNEERVYGIKYNKSEIRDNFYLASCCLQKQAIKTIFYKQNNKDKLPDYKFNENICVCCNKIINYCKEYYKLIFCYHYKDRYVKFFKLNICSEECSNDFVYSNSADNHPPNRYDILKAIERYNKDKIYCIRTKYKYCPNNG